MPEAVFRFYRGVSILLLRGVLPKQLGKNFTLRSVRPKIRTFGISQLDQLMGTAGPFKPRSGILHPPRT